MKVHIDVMSDMNANIGALAAASVLLKDLKFKDSQCRVVVRVLHLDLGDPGTNPHSAMEACLEALGQSEILSLIYFTKDKIDNQRMI